MGGSNVAAGKQRALGAAAAAGHGTGAVAAGGGGAQGSTGWSSVGGAAAALGHRRRPSARARTQQRWQDSGRSDNSAAWGVGRRRRWPGCQKLRPMGLAGPVCVAGRGCHVSFCSAAASAWWHEGRNTWPGALLAPCAAAAHRLPPYCSPSSGLGSAGLPGGC